MSAEEMLIKYVSTHPDYWEFEKEVKEVARLKELCKIRKTQHIPVPAKNLSQLQSCA